MGHVTNNLIYGAIGDHITDCVSGSDATINGTVL